MYVDIRRLGDRNVVSRGRGFRNGMDILANAGN